MDPGYVGHLFCPIYNLSDKPVTLQAGDQIAVMDFVKTTPFDRKKSPSELKRYPHPPKRAVLQDYGIDDLRSALFTKAGAKLVEFEEEIKSLNARFNFFMQISFAIFALLISVVAVLSRVNSQELSLSAAFWGATTITVSVVALLVALFSYVHRRIGRLVFELYGRVLGERAHNAQRYLNRAWLLGVGTCISLTLIAGAAVYSATAPFFQDLRQQRVLVKSDLDGLGTAMSAKMGELSSRVDHIEGTGVATTADLQRLRAELAQQIRALRPSAPVSQ